MFGRHLHPKMLPASRLFFSRRRSSRQVGSARFFPFWAIGVIQDIGGGGQACSWQCWCLFIALNIEPCLRRGLRGIVQVGCRDRFGLKVSHHTKFVPSKTFFALLPNSTCSLRSQKQEKAGSWQAAKMEGKGKMGAKSILIFVRRCKRTTDGKHRPQETVPNNTTAILHFAHQHLT